jgi:hypothetical protein
MRFMYVDESGDPGRWDTAVPEHLRPSRHYILTGVILPASLWREYLDVLIRIRRQIRKDYGFFARAELHAANLINPRGDKAFKAIPRGRSGRVALYHDFLQGVTAGMPDLRIINVHLNKANPRYASSKDPGFDAEGEAWERLVQRFQNHLRKDSGGDLGMILADETNEVKVRRIMRRMRVYNQTPSRIYKGTSYSNPVDHIVEDPVMRNSEHSYFVQIADLVSHALYRDLYPKGGYRKYNVDRLFNIMDGVLLKAASTSDPRGIVHL